MKALFQSLLAAVFAGLLVVTMAPPAAAAWSFADRYDGPQTRASNNRVILTYDDCPDKTLQGLRNYKRTIRKAVRMNVAITIAPLGNCRDYFKRQFGVNIADYARQHGQYVISHSKTHPDLTTLSNRQIRQELRCCSASVASRYVRAPYGSYDARVLQVMHNMPTPRRLWLWSIDTRDWTGKSQNQVVNHVNRYTRDGDTVLMHLQWNGFSPRALERMVLGLRQRGHPVCRTYRGADHHSSNPVQTTRHWFWRMPC
ncbi:MAG TPA: polysaccharide deacetylase family protein [Candidatus Saccharimonadales bacterium]|nr:polysaccharide deacetylase family protein [Candidatus Saccharimonadales bacterium]